MTINKLDLFGETKATPAFGIDLGTTNSMISVVRSGNTPEGIIVNGKMTMPSCVMWLGGDKFVVGTEAYKQRYLPNVAYSIKRKMGTDKNITLEYNGERKTFSPKFLSSIVLRELVKSANSQYEDIKDVVITVPAYFNQNQIKDTIEAGKLAGLNVLDTFKEPNAASICYARVGDMQNKESHEQTILVYDLGGGTFDVSVVKIVKNRQTEVSDSVASTFEDLYGIATEKTDKAEEFTFEVLAIDGDTQLGGDDIDRAMLRLFLRKLDDLGYNTRKMKKEEREKYLLELEKYKRQIGTYNMHITKLMDEDVDIQLTFTQDEILKVVSGVYTRTLSAVNNVISKVGRNTIDSIVLVGGSTKSPYIRYLLEQDFKDMEISIALNPDEAVGLGAGVKAKLDKFGLSNLKIMDILPLSIGINADDKMSTLIPEGQSVPYSKTMMFATTEDDQEFAYVDIYQGNSKFIEECTFLGRLEITELPKGEAGSIGIVVRLSVSSSGNLSVSVNVDNKVYDKDLVNVFKSDLSVELPEDLQSQDSDEYILTPKDKKKLVRWKALAEKCEGETREQFDKLLNDFIHGENNEKEIITFVRQFSRVKDIQSGESALPVSQEV